MKTYEKPRLDETNPLAMMDLVDLVTIVYFDVTSKTYTVWDELRGQLLIKVNHDRIEIMNDAHFTRIPYIGVLQ